MSGSPDEPFFQAALFPSLMRRGRSQTPRFLIKTRWEVAGSRPGRSEFQKVDSLLALDDLYVSFLPFTFRQEYAIMPRPVSWPVGSWNGVECDFAETMIRLPSLDTDSGFDFRLLVRLPRARANPEPVRPLIGSEFLRHYCPRVLLEYSAFTWGMNPDIGSAVGFMEWT